MNKREKIMHTYHHHTMVTINFGYTKWNHEQKEKQLWELATVWLSHHDDDQFYLHKMKPWIIGEKMMGTYHRWPLHHNDDQLCSMPTKNENMKGVNKVK
jgi:hypothetical protein